MMKMKLHAVAAAFLLGTATLGGGMMLMTAPAYAAVRAVVGEPLQQAMALANKGDYKGAMALVDKAGTASEKTAEEVSLIAQVKNYIGSKSGDISLGGAAAGKNKLASDYTARNYAGVIADGDALKKAGALDSTTAAVVAQAYYLSGNKAGCIKYIQTDVGSAADEPTLQLLMKCAFDTNDSATQRNALEQLVAKTGKGEYWTQLIKMQETAKGLTDTQSLQLYRLKFLTGTLAGKDDYINMAQLDLQLGLPAEASTVLDKGMAAGLLNDDRSKKLQALAKQQSAQVVSGMAAAQAAADKDPSGDAQVRSPCSNTAPAPLRMPSPRPSLPWPRTSRTRTAASSLWVWRRSAPVRPPTPSRRSMPTRVMATDPRSRTSIPCMRPIRRPPPPPLRTSRPPKRNKALIVPSQAGRPRFGRPVFLFAPAGRRTWILFLDGRRWRFEYQHAR